MKTISRLSFVALLATLALGLFLGSLSAAPATEKPSDLHYKSRAGLMLPAYGALSAVDEPHRAGANSPSHIFSSYITVEVGSWPQILSLADLTSDTRPDVAIATDNDFDPDNDERLHLFTTQSGDLVSRTQRLPAGRGPESLATGDFNRDGRLDVALALAGENAVLVYTQTPTLGLSLPVTLPVLGESNAVAAGDFSGDLHDDLAVIAPLSETIYVWQSWHGSQITLTLPYPTGGYDALDVGDLDNDGDDDLVALRGAGYVTNSLVIYWQDVGHFPISTTLTPETGGYLPHSLAVGDVNHDGLDDVIVTAGGNTPNAYLNVFLQGLNGPMTTPITYPAFHLPSAVAIGDVDHDGLNDVVVAHDAWQTLSVYTQTVSGTLSTYATVSIPYSDRYRPDALGLADLDNNGGLDAALVDRDHGLIILTNTLSAPRAVIVSPTHTSLHLPGPLTITGNTSSGSLTVEVRLKGHTDWLTTTLLGTTWETTLTLPSSERAWWLEARAIDAQGHVQSPVARTRIGVEDGPPHGDVIINDGAYATNQPTVTLTLPVYDVGGVTGMRFSLDTIFFTNWLSYTSTYTWVFEVTDGPKTLYAEFKDNEGHVSDLISDAIILDTLPPTSYVTTPPLPVCQATFTISWTGDDAGSGIAFYDVEIQDTSMSMNIWVDLLYHTPFTQTTLGGQVEHTYCFRSRAIDRAGNVEVWPQGDGDTCFVVVPESCGIKYVYLPLVMRHSAGTIYLP